MVRTYSPTVDIVKQTVSAQNVDVRTLPVESVELISKVETATVASGSSQITTIASAAGYINEVLGLEMKVYSDADATAGDNQLIIFASGDNFSFLSGKSTYSSNLFFRRLVWQIADSNQLPATDAAQVAAVKGIRFDENNPLKIQYKNNTDAAMENDRKYYLWTRKIKVA